MDLYARIRRACHVEGMSVREAARKFGVHRATVRKMLTHSVPPGYRRDKPRRRPKLAVGDDSEGEPQAPETKEKDWWRWVDSNHRPRDYEALALTT